MQLPKREIEAKIVEIAQAEFLNKGYAKTTIRTIAQKADISLGNFYTYFKGKKALFTKIVQPVYQLVNELKTDFFNFENEKDFRDPKFLTQFISLTSRDLALLIQTNRSGLILLLDKSGGTQFEGFKMQLIRMIEQDLKEDLQSQGAPRSLYQAKNGPLFLIAKNLIEVIVETSKNVADTEHLNRTLRQFMHYHFNGIVSLLAGKIK